MEKYQDLKKEIIRLWKLRNVEILPVVIGTLGSVSAEFNRWMGKLQSVTKYYGNFKNYV